MIQLYRKECKKLFCKKVTLLLFLLAVIFGFAGAGTNMPSYEYSEGYVQSGQLLTGSRAEQEYYRIQHEYAGDVDEAWLTKVKADLKQSELQDTLMLVDEVNMKKVYGEDWKALYLSDPDSYEIYTEKVITEIKKENPEAEIGKAYYVLDYGNSIKTIALQDMVNYGSTFVGKPWNSASSKTMELSDGRIIETQPYFPREDMSKGETEYLTSKYNQVDSFYYDHYEGWDNLLSGLATARFFVAIVIIFATSRLLNEDHSYEMYDIIKSTSYGKQKLVFVKLLALATFCIATVAMYSLILTLSAYFLHGLGNWNVSMIALTNRLNYYTIQEAYFGGIGNLMIGALSIGSLCACLSALIKKNYISFLISIVLVIIPVLILPSAILQLVPLEYMDFAGIFFNNSVTSLLGSYQSILPIIYTTSSLVILLTLIITVISYRSYHIVKA